MVKILHYDLNFGKYIEDIFKQLRLHSDNGL